MYLLLMLIKFTCAVFVKIATQWVLFVIHKKKQLSACCTRELKKIKYYYLEVTPSQSKLKHFINNSYGEQFVVCLSQYNRETLQFN